MLSSWDELGSDPPCFFFFLAVLGLQCRTGFSLVVASRGYSLVAVRGLLIAIASRCRAQGLECVSFSSSDTWAQEFWFPASRTQAR